MPELEERESMKNVLLPLMAAGVVYLLGAFGNACFDITQWDVFSRVMVAFFMALVAAATAGAMQAMRDGQ